MHERFLSLLGWSASTMAVLMYFAYIDQIRLNLEGHKGSVLQPLAAVGNCALWSLYGFLREKREWPIVAANLPGVFFGLAALFTAF